MQIRKTNSSFTVSDFKIVFKHNHETYERNEEDSGRTYNVGELKIPSVTTILSSTQSKEKQESLQKWRDRVGEKEAARITSQAATRGTEMHYVLEQYLKRGMDMKNLQSLANEFHQKLNNLLGIMLLTELELRKEFLANFLRWQQSSVYSPIEGVEICEERYLSGFPMPWEIRK